MQTWWHRSSALRLCCPTFQWHSWCGNALPKGLFDGKLFYRQIATRVARPTTVLLYYSILFYSFIHSCTHFGYVPVTACYGTHVGVREQLNRADCLILPHESQSSKTCHQDWQASSFVHWVISLAQVLDSLYWKQRQHSLINQHSWRSRKSRKKSFVLV